MPLLMSDSSSFVRPGRKVLAPTPAAGVTTRTFKCPKLFASFASSPSSSSCTTSRLGEPNRSAHVFRERKTKLNGEGGRFSSIHHPSVSTHLQRFPLFAFMPQVRHHVQVLSPLWGHIRPMISSALHSLAQHPDLRKTFLVQPAMLKNLRNEIASHAYVTEVEGRLTLIACMSDWEKGFATEPLLEDYKTGTGCPREVMGALMKGEGGKVWDKGQSTHIEICSERPSLYIFDMFAQHLSVINQETAVALSIDISSIPRLMAFPSTAASLIHHFAAVPHGTGLAGVWEQSISALEEQGEVDTSFEGLFRNEAFAEEIGRRFVIMDGKLVEGPGQAPMLDHEHFPQLDSVPMPPAAPTLVAFASYSFNKTQTGAILPWASSILEPGALKRARHVLPGKEIYAIGPQGPDNLWENKRSTSSAEESEREPTLKFLDGILQKRGEKKALYISFGSIFFPSKRPDIIVHLMETLAELQIPFVFALASPFAVLPEDLVAKLEKSGLACFSKFAPQMDVLRHPATGGFLTHGGSNSTSEALVANVPLCFYPAMADQPAIAARLSQEGLAYELLQVRTGPSIGLPTARGVKIEGTPEAIVSEMKSTFTNLFGADGEKKRERLSQVNQELRKDRKDGDSAKEMRRLALVGNA